MSLQDLVSYATRKEKFQTIENYTAFCAKFLEYIETGLQARIVSQNETCYEFFQYSKDGYFNITRPINSQLMYKAETFTAAVPQFKDTLKYLNPDEHELDSTEIKNAAKLVALCEQSPAFCD
jgi:hypothetical protein